MCTKITIFIAMSTEKSLYLRSLFDNLTSLWKTFLDRVASRSVADYLSVEHLGIVLKSLGEQGKIMSIYAFH